MQKRRLMFASAALLLAAALPSAAQTGSVTVEQAWARPTVAGQKVGGTYLTLNNGGGADRLLGASSAAAAKVELHSMKMDGDVMRMRKVEAVDLPAGQTVALEPGGYHLMLVGLKQPLKAGASFPLTLRFAKAGELEVEVKVQKAQKAAPAGEHEHHEHHKH